MRTDPDKLEVGPSAIPSALPISGKDQLVVEVDVRKYLEHTRELDLSEDQQVQLLQAMWQIMKAFVDVGFKIHPVQHALEARHRDNNCGEHPNSQPEHAPSLSEVIECLIAENDDLSSEFNAGAAPVKGGPHVCDDI